MGLDLTFGRSLKALPRGCGILKNLVYLALGNCQGLRTLPPTLLGNLKNLKNLNLKSCTHLKELPTSIGKLQKLEILNLANCANLKQLPKSIGKLEMLVTLNLFQCSTLESLPFKNHSLKRLEYLNLLGCDNEMLRRSYVGGLINLRNVKIDADTLDELESKDGLEDLTLHTGAIEVINSHILNPTSDSLNPTTFFNLKTLRLSSLPKLQTLGLNDCPNLVNLTLNNCYSLERVALYDCPNLICLPAFDSLPCLRSLRLKLSIKELPQSFTRRGAFPALTLFNLEESQLVKFPEVEEGAMPKLEWLDFDDCIFLHTLPASISLLTSIETINLGSKNEKLMTSCKTNFRNSTIRKTFIVDGKHLIPEEEVFESIVPMQEGTTTVRGSDKRPFQKVHGDDEERLLKRGGLGSDFIMPSSSKRFVYLASSSMAKTTKSEKEHGLCEAL